MERILNNLVDLTIEKLVMGGDGLARVDGKVIFVRGGLPGEKVTAKIIENKKDFARAEVIKIHTASNNRAQPVCPAYGICGGCDWMHIHYATQIATKEELFRESIYRSTKVHFDKIDVYTSTPLNYRSRAQFSSDSNGNWGFLGANSHQVVALNNCPVLAPEINQLLQNTEPLQNALSVWIARQKQHNRLYDKKPIKIKAFSGTNGITYSPELQNNAYTSVNVLGKTFYVGAESFFQSNLSLVPNMVEYVTQNLSGKIAIDMYGGVGLFGAFLADTFEQVIWIEENQDSLHWAEKNLPANKTKFFCSKAEDWMANHKDITADVLVVDPPRLGLSPIVKEGICHIGAHELILVSCYPPTLARDLSYFLAHGYEMQGAALFDFYPQTSHIEAVVKLHRI